MDYTDKDSIQHTMSPIVFSLQLQYESIQDSLDPAVKQYVCQCFTGSVIGFIVKE